MSTARIFDHLLTKGVRSGQIPSRTQEARDWYRKAAKSFSTTTGNSVQSRRIDEKKFIRSDKTRLTREILPGNMYMYMYDPKYKETLPFYDRFPLIFPFKVQADRFWGINLHYLNLRHRAVLMDGLYQFVNNERYDETTKLKFSYELLNSTAKTKFFKPCVKQYLKSHMKSQCFYVYPSEWDTALFLPLERFEKKNKRQVWASSKSQLSA